MQAPSGAIVLAPRDSVPLPAPGNRPFRLAITVVSVLKVGPGSEGANVAFFAVDEADQQIAGAAVGGAVEVLERFRLFRIEPERLPPRCTKLVAVVTLAGVFRAFTEVDRLEFKAVPDEDGSIPFAAHVLPGAMASNDAVVLFEMVRDAADPAEVGWRIRASAAPVSSPAIFLP